jgi:hypothetical protein
MKVGAFKDFTVLSLFRRNEVFEKILKKKGTKPQIIQI